MNRVANRNDDSARPHALSDPSQWVDVHGDRLFGFALKRVADPNLAEDLVQETFLAAIRSRDRFAGRSSELSWLVGILKNKIMDHFRRSKRESVFSDMDSLADEQYDRFLQDGFFKEGWIHERGPLEWGENPGESLDREQFWDVFHSCSDKLPEKIARVFHLREVDEIASEEICKALDITPNNLWVMLHRARMAMRQCLEVKWFAPSSD